MNMLESLNVRQLALQRRAAIIEKNKEQKRYQILLQLGMSHEEIEKTQLHKQQWHDKNNKITNAGKKVRKLEEKSKKNALKKRK